MTPAQIKALKKAIRDWWVELRKTWLETAQQTPADPHADTDLWDDMPVVESKQIARTNTLFEEHLGIKLDVKLIRPGGYQSIEDAIDDLVPKMVAKAAEKAQGAA